MGRARQDDGRVTTGQAAGKGFNPFARLLREAGLAPEPGASVEVAAGGPEPSESQASAGGEQRAEAGSRRAGRVTVRSERKGHGGKTVTRVDGLSGDGQALEALARRLGKALGCGARVEGGTVLAQGDIAARVEAWLQEQGARLE